MDPRIATSFLCIYACCREYNRPCEERGDRQVRNGRWWGLLGRANQTLRPYYSGLVDARTDRFR